MARKNKITLSIDVTRWLQADCFFVEAENGIDWGVVDNVNKTRHTLPFASQAWCSVVRILG